MTTSVSISPGFACCDGGVWITTVPGPGPQPTLSGPGPLPTVPEPWPLPSVSVPPLGSPSSACDTGTQVHHGTIAGVQVKLYLRQPASDAVHVCFRIAGQCGRIEVTPTSPDVDVTGLAVPGVDTNPSACATANPPNEMPGPLPLAGGSSLGTPYLVDAYVSGSTVWVCVQVGTVVAERIIVPVSVPSVSANPGTQTAYYSDPS